MQKYKIFCDLEFSDSDPMRGQILEAAFAITDNNLNPVNHFHALVRPELINTTTWKMAAQDIHKITPQAAMNHPYSRGEFCLNLLYFLKPYYDECGEPQEFVCHAWTQKFFNKKTNSFSFPYIDYFMLEWAMRYEGYFYSMQKMINQSNMISTITMAQDAEFFAMVPDPKTGKPKKRYKLNLLCDLIGHQLDHHKAMSDVYGCMAIYKHCSNAKMGM